MKVLRGAVIGLGRVGWIYHVPEMAKKEGFELVSAVDTNPDRLKELKDEYGVDGYTDLVEMLENVKPDLVAIASPTHLHKEHAITVMEHGADVFLDKPATINVQELLEVQAVAKRLGRKVMVYQPHRAKPVVNVLREILAQNKIGDVYMIKRACTGYSRRNDWQALKKFGGGMLNNYGAHFIDQLRFFVEEPIEAVSCNLRTIATVGDADDVVKAVFESKSGVLLDLDINLATAYDITPWMVFGKYGTILCTNEFGADCELLVKYLKPEELPKVELQSGLSAKGRTYSPDKTLPWHEEHVPITADKAVDFYDKCYEYFALDKEPFVPLEETVELMKIIEKCHEIAGE